MRTSRFNEPEIIAYLLANPTVTSEEAGNRFGCLPVTLRAIAKRNGVSCERINRWHRNQNTDPRVTAYTTLELPTKGEIPI
jgi:hypothetical protein